MLRLERKRSRQALRVGWPGEPENCPGFVRANRWFCWEEWPVIASSWVGAREREREREREIERERERYENSEISLRRETKKHRCSSWKLIVFKTERPACECERFQNIKINVYGCVWGRGEQEKKAIMILGCFWKTHVLLRRWEREEDNQKMNLKNFDDGRNLTDIWNWK